MEQIEQGSQRRPLHLAQVLQMAMHEGKHGPAGDYPEDHYPYLAGARPRHKRQLSSTTLLLGAGAALAGGYLLWQLGKKNSAGERRASAP
jgi:hypothetical protein